MAKNSVEQVASVIGKMSAREKSRLDQQLRTTVNSVYTKTATLRTAQTGVATTIWLDKDPVPFDSTITVQAKVMANDPGSPPTAYCGLEMVQQYARGPTDVAVMFGAPYPVTKFDARSNVAFAMTFGIDGTSHIFIQVNDGGIITMDWKIWVEYRRDT